MIRLAEIIDQFEAVFLKTYQGPSFTQSVESVAGDKNLPLRVQSDDAGLLY